MNFDRLYTRLEEKMTKQLGYRGDLYVADYKQINKGTVKMLVGYNTSLNQPTISDVSKFIVKSFCGRVVPKLETARIYVNDGAISLIATKVRVTRPLESKNKLLAISSTLFLDQSLGDKWEVEKSGDSMFLARVDEEDIGNIVSQRMQQMQIQSSTLTFASLKGAVCVATVTSGDTVKFFKDNKMMEGKVISVGPVKVTIRVNGTSVAVDPAAIVEVVKVGTSAKKDSADVLRDYYQNAYPEKYGDVYINLYEKND